MLLEVQIDTILHHIDIASINASFINRFIYVPKHVIYLIKLDSNRYTKQYEHHRNSILYTTITAVRVVHAKTIYTITTGNYYFENINYMLSILHMVANDACTLQISQGNVKYIHNIQAEVTLSTLTASAIILLHFIISLCADLLAIIFSL